ncbi:MAG: hypothetical protein EOP06_15515, partial [Proteobacteria bacterium]
MKIFLTPLMLSFVIVSTLLVGAKSFGQTDNPQAPPASLPAPGSTGPTTPDVPPAPGDEITWEQWFFKSNIAVSEWFDGVAEGLDLFLVGKKLTNKRNESFIRIENTTVSSEGSSPGNSFAFIVNPRLQNLEEYWHLKFSTYDEQEERRNVKNEYLRQTQRRENYGAT